MEGGRLMEFLQLQYFQKVAKLEHMTKAAEELRIAQPALSKTISRLETHVGVPLFDRHRGRIRLNDFGRAFLNKVEQAMILLEEGRTEVRELAGLELGSLHIGTSTTELLSKPLGAFLAEHPEVKVQITQAQPHELEALVDAGKVDLGFTALRVQRAGLRQAVVLKEEIYLLVPPGHRFAERESIDLREAAKEPFIGYKENFGFQKLNDALLREAGIAPRFVCRVDGPQAVASLVAAGLGIAFTGCKTGRDKGLALVRIETPAFQRDFHVIWSEHRYFSQAAHRFREFVVQFFADETSARS